jgi:transcriptional antiterminator Rof (Rho-off)
MKYKLINDLPNLKAGTIFTLSSMFDNLWVSPVEDSAPYMFKPEIITQTDWFRPIAEVGDWVRICRHNSTAYAIHKVISRLDANPNVISLNYCNQCDEIKLATKEEVITHLNLKLGDKVYHKQSSELTTINSASTLDNIIKHYYTEYLTLTDAVNGGYILDASATTATYIYNCNKLVIPIKEAYFLLRTLSCSNLKYDGYNVAAMSTNKYALQKDNTTYLFSINDLQNAIDSATVLGSTEIVIYATTQ